LVEPATEFLGEWVTARAVRRLSSDR